MRQRACRPIVAGVLLFFAVQVRAQIGPPAASEDREDPKAILELGAATSWNTSGGAATFAPSLGAEITPIEKWLELEGGITAFYTPNSREWDGDLLFKKPWTISHKAEFMLGAGPQWSHITQSGRTRNSWAAEVAADFMFWPDGKHRIGWYIEPVFDCNFSGSHQKSIGISAGLLIGFH